MDKVYNEVRFASLIWTPYNLTEDVDDVEFTLTLMRAATSFVREYSSVVKEEYSVEGIRNAIIKLYNARKNGKPDVLWSIYRNIDIEEGQNTHFYRNCKTFYAKIHLLEISEMYDVIDKMYINAAAKLERYIKFKHSMEENGNALSD